MLLGALGYFLFVYRDRVTSLGERLLSQIKIRH
jgi:hypothetical protein